MCYEKMKRFKWQNPNPYVQKTSLNINKNLNVIWENKVSVHCTKISLFPFASHALFMPTN